MSPAPLHNMADRMPYQPVATNLNSYGEPSSASGRESQYYTPEAQHLSLHEDQLPHGAAPPHFMGAAARDRSSFASSRPTLTGDPSEYPLNEGKGLYNYGYSDADPNPSQANLAKDSYGTTSPYLSERSPYAPKRRSRRRAIVIGSIIALLILVGVALGVYFAVIKPRQERNETTGNTSSDDKSSTSGSNTSTKGSTTGNLAVLTGGDGSTVTKDDGSTFKYENSFGGTWYYDPQNPLVSGARPQEWTPAINETFKYGEDPVRGVNLGGWLVMEPFITPSYFEEYNTTANPALDEWHLHINKKADGTIGDIENHYKTFITEDDFAQIAAAGLNHVRIPIPWWAIEVRDNEPFLPKVQWSYFLKAIQWARKYGLRINLDFHAVPGSQNGWNHSGRLGDINWLRGPMGVANAQRTLDYIRIISEFISQPAYSDVVTMLGIINEPAGMNIGNELVLAFAQAYQVVRKASGLNKGPWVVFHNGFSVQWGGFLPNADRIHLDIHQYLVFGPQSTDDFAARVQAGQPCTAWGKEMNDSMRSFGLTSAGEWSMAINDCGLFLNAIDGGSRYDGTYKADLNGFPRVGDCAPWDDWQSYSPQQKADMQQFALQAMSALQHWFFWTWKVGPSKVTGKVETPFWSYQLGLTEGWIPKDPRQSEGVCESTDPWVGPLSIGTGDVDQAYLDGFPWPPTGLSNVANPAETPVYTQTGSIVTLPNPTFTASGGATPSASAGSGWNNPSDTDLLWVPIATCGFLDPWMGYDTDTPACPPVNARREEKAFPAPTAPPSPR